MLLAVPSSISRPGISTFDGLEDFLRRIGGLRRQNCKAHVTTRHGVKNTCALHCLHCLPEFIVSIAPLLDRNQLEAPQFPQGHTRSTLTAKELQTPNAGSIPNDRESALF